MKRKSGSGIFSPSPNSKKKVKRTQAAETKSKGGEESVDNSEAITNQCKGCQKAMKAVADMEKTLETLAKLREETDAIHKKSVEEANKLAERARTELAQSKERAATLQSEIDSLNAALKSSDEETSALKQQVTSKQEEIIALKQSALDKESEWQQQQIQLQQQQQQIQLQQQQEQQQKKRRRSSLQIQSPGPLSPAKASTPSKKGGKNGDKSKGDDVLSFYGMLTGISVVPRDEGYECVLENKEKARMVKFRIVVEENGTAHYTPLTIDVPDRVPGDVDDGTEAVVVGCVLTEMVTEPIDFPTSQLPVFLSKLIDELFM